MPSSTTSRVTPSNIQAQTASTMTSRVRFCRAACIGGGGGFFLVIGPRIFYAARGPNSNRPNCETTAHSSPFIWGGAHVFVGGGVMGLYCIAFDPSVVVRRRHLPR